MPSRYDNLNAAVTATVKDSKNNKPYRIVEIGVHHAVRAVMMVKLAKKLGRTNIEYYGFDLFEDMTPNVNSIEFGKPTLAMSRDDARKLILAAGAAKVQLIKGDTKLSMPQAVKDIPTANVVFLDGGHTLETIASDLENILNCCSSNTHILLDDYYPGVYDKGCAFISKCFTMLKKHGIKIEELNPVDVVGDNKLSIRMLSLRCAAQLTPSTLLGFGAKLLNEACPTAEPEPQEFIPQATFIDDSPVDTSITWPECNLANVEKAFQEHVSKQAKTEVVSPVADITFPSVDSGCDTDVQSVRVCKNSCGKLPEEHCELPSDSCGRRESSMEPCGLGEVSEEPAAATSVSEEQQEPNQIVEPGNPLGLGTPCQSNSGGELRPEVSPELEQGNSRGSRRRRRRSGPSDERSGPQS